LGKGGLVEIAIVVDRADMKQNVEDISMALENIAEDLPQILERLKSAGPELREKLRKHLHAYEGGGAYLKPGMLDMLKGRTNPFY